MGGLPDRTPARNKNGCGFFSPLSLRERVRGISEWKYHIAPALTLPLEGVDGGLESKPIFNTL